MGAPALKIEEYVAEEVVEVEATEKTEEVA